MHYQNLDKPSICNVVVSWHGNLTWNGQNISDRYILDIYSKYGLFGCFNSIIGSYDILLINLNFVEDVWILIDYSNVMLLKYDGKKQISIFDVKYI